MSALSRALDEPLKRQVGALPQTPRYLWREEVLQCGILGKGLYLCLEYAYARGLFERQVCND
jgi:hypothetical protein